METLHQLWGNSPNLNIIQMSLRAIAIFFVTLILIRYTGMRVFGIKSAFDYCVIILLGSVLSRAVVGASPFFPTVIASTAFVIVHKIIAHISVGNQFLSHLVKGTPLCLYKDGILNDKNMRRCELSYGDVMEEIRLKLNQNSLDNVGEIFMERTGKISIIEKSKMI